MLAWSGFRCDNAICAIRKYNNNIYLYTICMLFTLFSLAVTLNINGYAETQWRENRGAGKNRTRDTYRAREDYIASQTYLAGSNLSSKSDKHNSRRCFLFKTNAKSISLAEVSLEPGIHVYNFTCQIPAICPSSIEGHFGRVRYMTKVSLVRPWKFDQSYTRCFTVLRLMDLNYNGPLLRVGWSHMNNSKHGFISSLDSTDAHTSQHTKDLLLLAMSVGATAAAIDAAADRICAWPDNSNQHTGHQ